MEFFCFFLRFVLSKKWKTNHLERYDQNKPAYQNWQHCTDVGQRSKNYDIGPKRHKSNILCLIYMKNLTCFLSHQITFSKLREEIKRLWHWCMKISNYQTVKYPSYFVVSNESMVEAYKCRYCIWFLDGLQRLPPTTV